ncbi:MAG: hypothetical protein WD749_00780 [Phycisphaerales bacterium]
MPYAHRPVLLPRVSLAGALLAAPVLVAPAALAQTDSFHWMQIEQVVGGVGGDTTKQAVQLRQRFFGQNFIAGTQLVAFDAAGQNPVVLITFPTNVPNGDDGDRILVTTAGFPAPVAPDFVMTSPIPASYLAAGRITFQFFGLNYWSLAWGGAAYTGPNTGTLDNDADGNFGPPFAGPCPSAGVQGLLFQGPASAPSTNNAADYALTTGAAELTNNARASGTVTGPPPSCYANCDNSTQAPVLNVADFGCFLTRYAAGEAYANCDESTQAPVLNVADFGCFLTRYAAGCP